MFWKSKLLPFSRTENLDHETSTVPELTISHKIQLKTKSNQNIVGCATTKDATTNECYNEQFLSIKSGRYNEHRCYNEREGILSADVARACEWRAGPSCFD